MQLLCSNKCIVLDNRTFRQNNYVSHASNKTECTSYGQYNFQTRNETCTVQENCNSQTNNNTVFYLKMQFGRNAKLQFSCKVQFYIFQKLHFSCKLQVSFVCGNRLKNRLNKIGLKIVRNVFKNSLINRLIRVSGFDKIV